MFNFFVKTREIWIDKFLNISLEHEDLVKTDKYSLLMIIILIRM